MQTTPRPLLGTAFLLVFLLGEYESYSEFGPHIGFLEAFWVCSLSMLLASLGCFASNPNYLAVSVLSVFSGHTLWCLDSISLLFRGGEGFLGMADYSGINGVSVFSILGVSHHLWFIPSCIYILRQTKFELKPAHWVFSYAFVSLTR